MRLESVPEVHKDAEASLAEMRAHLAALHARSLAQRDALDKALQHTRGRIADSRALLALIGARLQAMHRSFHGRP